LESLLGKRVALMSDVRIGGRADMQEIAEHILRISGEDAVSVARKHRLDYTVRLQTRFVMLTNEVPALFDQSGALAGRFILLQMTRSFFGQEDQGLTDRLLGELPGILLWALDGLARLRDRGHLLQPASGQPLVRQLDTLASPIKAFIADRCIVSPEADVECAELFNVWQAWTREQGREHAGSLQMFGRNLSTACPEIKVGQRRAPDGTRPRFYQGIRVREEWEVTD
ncbi:MAG: DUF5906 domain-containing protein, partial [Vicinamibacterales bacterium]